MSFNTGLSFEIYDVEGLANVVAGNTEDDGLDIGINEHNSYNSQVQHVVVGVPPAEVVPAEGELALDHTDQSSDEDDEL